MGWAELVSQIQVAAEAVAKVLLAQEGRVVLARRVDLHPLAKDLARLLVGLLRLRLRVGAKRALEAVVQGAHDRDERHSCHR